MSLKLSVGLTPKWIRRTMHASPNTRRMIAEINGRKIFEQEQIASVVDLKLGVESADAIDIITGEVESKALADA